MNFKSHEFVRLQLITLCQEKLSIHKKTSSFKNGFNHPCSSISFYLKSKIVEVRNEMKKKKKTTFGFFLSECTFSGYIFFLPSNYPVNSILSVVDRMYKIHVFAEVFFTLCNSCCNWKWFFRHFRSIHCQEDKFLQQNYAVFQSKLSLKKWGKQMKVNPEKLSQRCIFLQSPDLDPDPNNENKK